MNNTWQFIADSLKANLPTILLYVLDSQGSSPGRQGFKMAVTAESMSGSIGGGIMEFKLVEKAKDMLKKRETNAFFIPQFHRKSATANQSGMICSGEQIVVLMPLKQEDLSTVNQIIKALLQKMNGTLEITFSGIQFIASGEQTTPFQYISKSDQRWKYLEQIGFKPTVHIVGGGHVGRACCELFNRLAFYVINYDDRKQLNTMVDNPFAHEKQIFGYETIGTQIPEGKHQYVVIMSFGYRSDKVIIKQLLNKQFAYLGMMGSKAKIEQLKERLLEEGISKQVLESVHMPIGMSIASKTPMEIAVSIAAQIIQLKNKGIS